MQSPSRAFCWLLLLLLGAGGAAQVPPPPAAAPQSPPTRPLQPPKLDMMIVTALFGSEPSAPPRDREPTPDEVALGKLLYHEPSLSKGGRLSCASCHDLSRHGQDNKAFSPGSGGKPGARGTPTTLNAFRHWKLGWDGRASTVEEQALASVLDPAKHGLADAAELVARIKAKPELGAAFAKAFPGAADPVTAANYQLAVGAFARTLVTRSPFDAFLDGDRKALTAEQKWGLKHFIEVGCTTCHMTRLVGGSMLQKLGLIEPFPTEDPGRFAVTGDEADRHFFKVSSLLNVEQTAPYFHNGKAATLAEAVQVMARTQLGRQLTDEQTSSIVAFLRALTGPVPAGAAVRSK